MDISSTCFRLRGLAHERVSRRWSNFAHADESFPKLSNFNLFKPQKKKLRILSFSFARLKDKQSGAKKNQKKQRHAEAEIQRGTIRYNAVHYGMVRYYSSRSGEIKRYNTTGDGMVGYYSKQVADKRRRNLSKLATKFFKVQGV